MDNRGQTTVFFSLIIGTLLLFTLLALEVESVHMGRVEIRSVVHSAMSSIEADYNRELFERYHIFLMDPTYGTDSEAMAEEKFLDYLEFSLNSHNNGIYCYTVKDIQITDTTNVLDDRFQLFKKQIMDYEKTEGIVKRAQKILNGAKNPEDDINRAIKETADNGVEIPETEEDGDGSQESEEVSVEDPRDVIKEILQKGPLYVVLPTGTELSSEKLLLENMPSKGYKDSQKESQKLNFWDITQFRQNLSKQSEGLQFGGWESELATLDYILQHFSTVVSQDMSCKLKCEIEYILKGKENDKENLEGVVSDIILMRMPVNYAYLLSDAQKQSEALTLAATICTATGTEPMIEVVKYLILGCWSYGESLCEVRSLLAGDKIPYLKTKENWCTNLKNLVGGKPHVEKGGLDYEDFLVLLLIAKHGNQKDICYARMLDVINLNLQEIDPNFDIRNCVGSLAIQGEVTMQGRYMQSFMRSEYPLFFREVFTY